MRSAHSRAYVAVWVGGVGRVAGVEMGPAGRGWVAWVGAAGGAWVDEWGTSTRQVRELYVYKAGGYGGYG